MSCFEFTTRQAVLGLNRLKASGRDLDCNLALVEVLNDGWGLRDHCTITVEIVSDGLDVAFGLLNSL